MTLTYPMDTVPVLIYVVRTLLLPSQLELTLWIFAPISVGAEVVDVSQHDVHLLADFGYSLDNLSIWEAPC